MMRMKAGTARMLRRAISSVLLCVGAANATAALFEDDEARRAILDLRARIEAVRLAAEQNASHVGDDAASLRRSLLELQSQIETLRSETAKLRGLNEQLSRDLAETQRRQKDFAQSVEDRLHRFEPAKVAVDGREFIAEPAEKRDFENALAVFRKGDFSAAQAVFVDFLKRYPKTGYAPSALFWLGNAQYATRDYKEAIINFRALIAADAEHLRAPEAVLSIANCQIELKDTKAARKTLEDLIKAYPQSEAAVAARERLARLK